MTEVITKEQIRAEKDKEAILAMKSAKNNMEIALSRINTLESCALNLGKLVDSMLEHVTGNTYSYEGKISYKDSFIKRKTDLISQV